jgi:hypothetical protein
MTVIVQPLSHHTRISRPPARRFEPTARREITNYKHHLILELGQINSKLQYPNLK